MAEERARKMVDEQEIVRAARSRAEETISSAENKSREIHRAMNEYVAETLKSAEEAVAQSLDIIRQSRQRYRSAAAGYSKSGTPREEK
jgi:hypothetical protein